MGGCFKVIGLVVAEWKMPICIKELLSAFSCCFCTYWCVLRGAEFSAVLKSPVFLVKKVSFIPFLFGFHFLIT